MCKVLSQLRLELLVLGVGSFLFPKSSNPASIQQMVPPQGTAENGEPPHQPSLPHPFVWFYSFISVFMFSCAGPSSLCGLSFGRGERGCSNEGWSVSGGPRASPGGGRSLEPGSRRAGWCRCRPWDPPRPGTEHASPGLAGGLCLRAPREALSDLCLREMNFITFRPLQSLFAVAAQL